MESSLPPELIFHILFNLGPLDAWKMRGVCRRWREVAEQVVVSGIRQMLTKGEIGVELMILTRVHYMEMRALPPIEYIYSDTSVRFRLGARENTLGNTAHFVHCHPDTHLYRGKQWCYIDIAVKSQCKTPTWSRIIVRRRIRRNMPPPPDEELGCTKSMTWGFYEDVKLGYRMLSVHGELGVEFLWLDVPVSELLRSCHRL
ncbi:uncharacterized protein VTP21DRAFT_9850 [Calcarisporiella thermophila]|uniref:uncharacterized protein n=1 Tax=Calcarisporiella thermophila TaxID=911321 RepID=UPI00374482C5